MCYTWELLWSVCSLSSSAKSLEYGKRSTAHDDYGDYGGYDYSGVGYYGEGYMYGDVEEDSEEESEEEEESDSDDQESQDQVTNQLAECSLDS